MGKREIIDIIKSNKTELAAARGEERESSDIDILVSFSQDMDLFDFIDLREFLETKLQAKIDLVMHRPSSPLSVNASY